MSRPQGVADEEKQGWGGGKERELDNDDEDDDDVSARTIDDKLKQVWTRLDSYGLQH